MADTQREAMFLPAAKWGQNEMQTIEPQKHTEFGRVNDQDSGLKDKFDF